MELPPSIFPCASHCRPTDGYGDRSLRCHQFPICHEVIKIAVMNIQEIWVSGFEGGQKTVQGVYGWIAEVFDRGMKIDGMHGDDQWGSAGERLIRQAHVGWQRGFCVSRFKVERAAE